MNKRSLAKRRLFLCTENMRGVNPSGPVRRCGTTLSPEGTWLPRTCCRSRRFEAGSSVLRAWWCVRSGRNYSTACCLLDCGDDAKRLRKFFGSQRGGYSQIPNRVCAPHATTCERETCRHDTHTPHATHGQRRDTWVISAPDEMSLVVPATVPVLKTHATPNMSLADCACEARSSNLLFCLPFLRTATHEGTCPGVKTSLVLRPNAYFARATHSNDTGVWACDQGSRKKRVACLWCMRGAKPGE